MDLEEAKSLLPEFFLTQLTEDYSPEDAERIIAGVATRRKTTLRANASLSTRDAAATPAWRGCTRASPRAAGSSRKQ